MCIIVAKNFNQTVDVKTLRRCFDSNPDGAGVAWTNGHGVTIQKGLLTWADFAKKALKYNSKEYAAVFHFRIATHGGVREELTHPFPITDDYSLLNKTKLKNLPFAVAHNGVFSMLDLDIPKNQSDTTAFIATLLTPILSAKINATALQTDEAAFDKIINLLVSGNRLAIINADGTIHRYGKTWYKKDGIFFSNTSYMESRSYGYYPYAYGKYGYPSAYYYNGKKISRGEYEVRKELNNIVSMK